MDYSKYFLISQNQVFNIFKGYIDHSYKKG